MKNNNPGQLSIFDIVLKHNVRSDIPSTVSELQTEPKIIRPPDKNFCPYHIPNVADIIKFIEKSVYKVDTGKLISDVFECGALAISNLVDKTQYDEREKRYMEIIKHYTPPPPNKS